MGDNAPLYSPLKLDGWKGLVLIKSGSSLGPQIDFASTEPWHTWLGMLVNDPGRLSEARVLKTSKTVEVLEVRVPLIPGSRPFKVICKQSKVNGIKDSLIGFWRPSAASRNFNKAQALQSHNIVTALPLAFMENRTARLSWLVTGFLEDVIDLDAYALTILSRAGAMVRRDRRNKIITSIGNLFLGLESAGLYHRDMKASNILLANAVNSTKPPRACIVDLDGLEKSRPWRSKWKPIVRLAASLLQYPAVTRADYARFLREYLVAGGEERRAWRTHYHRLRKQAARYAQAAQKRKSKKLDGFTGE
jgi:hypothetical protein